MLECKLVLGHLEIVLIFMQDMCMVAPKVPQAHKSFWTYPMVLLSDEAQVDARFGPFGDSANVDASQVTVYGKSTIGPEIVLDAPDGTPR